MATYYGNLVAPAEQWDPSSTYTFQPGLFVPVIKYNNKVYYAIDYPLEDGTTPDNDPAWDLLADLTGGGGTSDVTIESKDGTVTVNNKTVDTKGITFDLTAAGKSAYQVWLDAGHTGTVDEFLNSLIGPAGAAGATGPAGDPGASGLGLDGVTSSTSVLPTISNIDLTVNKTPIQTAIAVGNRIRMASRSNPQEFAEGVVSKYANNVITVGVDLINCLDAHADWNIVVTGQPAGFQATAEKGYAFLSNFMLNPDDPTDGKFINNGILPVVSTTDLPVDSSSFVLSFDSKTEQIVGLEANKVYQVDSDISYRALKAPAYDKHYPSYNGVDNPANEQYLLSQKADIANGSFINGNTFLANAKGGSVTIKPYVANGVFSNYATYIDVTPNRCMKAPNMTTSNYWTFFSQDDIANNSYIIYKNYGSNDAQALSLTPATYNRTGKPFDPNGKGWVNWFQPIGTRGSYVNLATCISDKWSVVFGNGNCTSVQISTDGTTFRQSGTFPALNMGPHTSIIVGDKFIAWSKSSKLGVVIDLATGNVLNNLNYPQTDINVNVSQVSSGIINGTDVVVAVNYNAADSVVSWASVKWATVNNPGVWNIQNTNLIQVTGSAGNFIRGICYNPTNRKWYAMACQYDSKNQQFKTFIARSVAVDDITTWELIQTIDGLNFGPIKYQKLNYNGSNDNTYVMASCRAPIAGVEDNKTISSVDGNSFSYVGNELALKGACSITTHPSGMMLITTSQTTMEARYTLDGVNFIKLSLNSNCQCEMLPLHNGFIRMDAGYNWFLFEMTYRYTVNGTNLPNPEMIFSGGYGVQFATYNDTSDKSFSGRGIVNYLYHPESSILSLYTSPLPLADDANANQFQVRVINMNANEKLSLIENQLIELDNSTEIRLVCDDPAVKIYGKPVVAQQAGVGYMNYKCVIKTASAPANVYFKAAFTDGENMMLSNSTIIIKEI